MTFDELVRREAARNKVPLHKAESIIRGALEAAAEAALTGKKAPLFPGIGRFVSVAVRSTGRKPDGTVWTKPGRTKLALSASVHAGGTKHVRAPQIPQAV